MSTSTSVYWYWVLEIRAPIVMSCAACIYNVMPQTGCNALFKRAITWSPPPLGADRLQRDEHTPVILGHGRPAGSDIGVARGDRGILCHYRQNRLHAVHH